MKKARSLVKVVRDVKLKLIGIIHLNTYFEDDIEIFQSKCLIWFCLGNKKSDAVNQRLFQSLTLLVT